MLRLRGHLCRYPFDSPLCIASLVNITISEIGRFSNSLVLSNCVPEILLKQSVLTVGTNARASLARLSKSHELQSYHVE